MPNVKPGDFGSLEIEASAAYMETGLRPAELVRKLKAATLLEEALNELVERRTRGALNQRQFEGSDGRYVRAREALKKYRGTP